MSPPPPLPQQIRPIDDRMAALTRRHLDGVLPTLFTYLMDLRGEVDRELTPVLAPAGGQPYPYGRCEEITRRVLEHLVRRLQSPAHPVEAALRAFVVDGGFIGTVWGVLRGVYFQNAFQFGGYYVDVANDTVVVTKPKVEILAMAESGLAPIRDLDHFRAVAASYWGATVWANVLVPSLAPLLPMVSFSPGKLVPGLQSACDYMIALMCRDGFRQAEAWLRDAPPPPDEVAAPILAGLPADLRPGADGRAAAVAACIAARAAGHREDGVWRMDRVRDYLRLMQARAEAEKSDSGRGDPA